MRKGRSLSQLIIVFLKKTARLGALQYTIAYHETCALEIWIFRIKLIPYTYATIAIDCNSPDHNRQS